MNPDPKKPEWAHHQADETAALALQQESAGPTHEPVNAPVKRGDEPTSAIVAAAVMKERERCARIVEGFPGDASLLRRVAAQIRNPV